MQLLYHSDRETDLHVGLWFVKSLRPASACYIAKPPTVHHCHHIAACSLSTRQASIHLQLVVSAIFEEEGRLTWAVSGDAPRSA